MGAGGEDRAERFYVDRGGQVVARNWRVRWGELDLVVLEDRQLVFVEVKTRRDASYFEGGVEAVTPAKQRRIERAARSFLAATRLEFEGVRFDVLVVHEDDIEHWEGAWEASQG